MTHVKLEKGNSLFAKLPRTDLSKHFHRPLPCLHLILLFLTPPSVPLSKLTFPFLLPLFLRFYLLFLPAPPVPLPPFYTYSGTSKLPFVLYLRPLFLRPSLLLLLAPPYPPSRLTSTFLLFSSSSSPYCRPFCCF